MLVYVVTSGAYSEYDIVGVFLNKEKAEYFTKFYLNGLDNLRVQEFETLDDYYMVDVRTVDYYRIVITDKGELSHLEKKQWEYSPNRNGMEFEETFKYNNGFGFVGDIIADSEEQAIKIMQDKRAEWLAEKYGV